MNAGVDYIGVSCVFVCHDGTGRVLMAKRGTGARDEHGAWDFGAGQLRHSESWEEAVRREVTEEYATLPKQIEYVTAGNSLRTVQGEPVHWVWLLFAVEVNPAEVRNNEPHKLDEIAWFTLDALPTPLHPSIPGCLSALTTYFTRQTVPA